MVRTDDKWRKWDFPQFMEALGKWTERKPIPARMTKKPTDRKKDS